MHFFVPIPWAAALLLASAAAALPAAEPLSLAEARRLAEARSLQLPAYDAASRAAREMAVAVGQRPDPVLRFGINNLPITGPDRFSLTRDFMTMRSVGVMQEFTRDDKRNARSAQFAREAEVAQAKRLLSLTGLQRDTALAWLERLFAERLRALLLALRDEARLQSEAADAVYRGGKGTQADLFAARTALAQIEDRIAQVELQVESATTLLVRWAGADGQRPLGDAPALDSVRLRRDDLEAQLAHHPQIALLLRKEAVARADVEAARAAQQSDPSIELMFSQRGPAFSNMVSVTVSVPWQWDRANRQDRELGARLAIVEQVAAERDEATRAHAAEALAMLQEWRSLRVRLQRNAATLSPLAQERTRAALAAYRGGNGTLAAVLEARRGEIDTRVEQLLLERDAARLWAQLDYLVAPDHASDAAAPVTR